MSTPFAVDLADLRFVLLEQLRVPERLAGTAHYAECDRDVVVATLEEGRRLACDVLAPVNRTGDRVGCRLSAEGHVTTPPGFREAWRQMADGGWLAASAPAELGGGGLPFVLSTALNEMFCGAAVAFMMYPGLTAAAGRMVLRFAAPPRRDLVASRLFSGHWAGTMCLTEAAAGSSVGDNRARARPADEAGVWLLEGEKIFISGGDHDLAENIVHLVLARTPNSPPGTKGLSLFMVPKFWFDDSGALQGRNGARVVGMEHKMGIHGSATCTLALGSDAPCRGWLLGNERGGIAHMFHMMNEARVGVAAQGEAMACAAWQYARRYAAERTQGTSLADARHEDAPRVTIDRHPDVRRMLMIMRVHAETMRAALLRLALDVDLAEHAADEAERARHGARAELLVPVLKSHCTDVGFLMAAEAVQVYGGYGYTSEFPVEQLLRDAKIQSIYEGTNGIQAMDLLGRKLRAGGGASLAAFLGEIGAAAAAARGAGLGKQARLVEEAAGALGRAAAQLGGTAAAGKLEEAFLHAVGLQRSFGFIACAAEALDQAVVAAAGDGRVAAAKRRNLDVYVHHVLPAATAALATVLSGDATPLDPDALSA